MLSSEEKTQCCQALGTVKWNVCLAIDVLFLTLAWNHVNQLLHWAAFFSPWARWILVSGEDGRRIGIDSSSLWGTLFHFLEIKMQAWQEELTLLCLGLCMVTVSVGGSRVILSTGSRRPSTSALSAVGSALAFHFLSQAPCYRPLILEWVVKNVWKSPALFLCISEQSREERLMPQWAGDSWEVDKFRLLLIWWTLDRWGTTSKHNKETPGWGRDPSGHRWVLRVGFGSERINIRYQMAGWLGTSSWLFLRLE